MKRLESLASLFVTLVEKRGSILDFYRSLDSRLRENDGKGNGNDKRANLLLLAILIPWFSVSFGG